MSILKIGAVAYRSTPVDLVDGESEGAVKGSVGMLEFFILQPLLLMDLMDKSRGLS